MNTTLNTLITYQVDNIIIWEPRLVASPYVDTLMLFRFARFSGSQKVP